MNERELIRRLVRALTEHNNFVWLLKQIIDYTRRSGKAGISAGATEELVRAYPSDPVDVISWARSFLGE